MPQGSVAEVLTAFIRLGLTSFGGPTAHLGYFREEFVVRRRWLDDRTYADLLALCQFLPGPASSQAGIAIGVLRAGLIGGLAAWLGFTLPSALIMIAAAYGIAAPGVDSAALRGLNIVAVAVVAQAVWGMARTLCPDRERATIALIAAVVLLVWQNAFAQISIIAIGGLAGWRLLRSGAPAAAPPLTVSFDRRIAIGCWIGFFSLLIALPLARTGVLVAHAGRVRQFLPCRCAGVRRRARCSSPAPRSGCAPRLGERCPVYRWLWSGAGASWSTVYLRSIPWRGADASAEWLDRRRPGVAGDLSPCMVADSWRASFLGMAAGQGRRSGSVARH